MANDIIITPVSASIQFSGSAYASIKLTVDASGSLLVSGNSGSLFSITDNLSGSLMSVNTIAGLPIMEVFSDNRVNIGKYASEAIKVQSGGSDVAFGSGSVMFVTSSGRVGIGVNTPLNKLDVAGNISCSAITASFFGTSSWSTNSLTASSLISGNSYNITNLTASNISASGTGSFGRVGIGTTSPAYLLDVSGSSRHGYRSADTHQFTGSVSISGSLNATSSWSTNALTSSYVSSSNVVGTVTSSSYALSASFAPTTITASWSTNALTASSLVVGNSYNITNLTASNISASGTGSFGRVGIGTTSPAYLLDVSGSSRHGYRSADTHQFTGSVSISGSLNATSSWSTNSLTASYVTSSNVVGTVASASYALSASSAPTTITASWSTNALTASSLISGNSYNITNLTASNISASGTGGFGNVGIGTTSPTGKLDIQGSSVHDLPTYSAEFLSASGWTSTGWTGSFDPPGWTHITGSTNQLYHDKVAVTSTKYQIAYTVTGRTTGSFTIAFGGDSLAGINASDAWGPTAVSTASLAINPTDTFNGTIVISIKSITATSTALVSIKSSDGVARIEIRANAATSSANNNTFIGFEAGRYNTTGVNNIAYGYNAFAFNTTGFANTAIGRASLYSNTTGYYNTANGGNALLNNTTGYNNTANGYGSLYSNTTGYYNTSNGMYSLLNNTTGYNNTSVGSEALLNNTTGYSNTAVGRVSLYYNTTGYYNVAIGMDSLEFNTTGYYNTAIGAISLLYNTTGYNNTAVGYSAGRTLTTGNSNTFLGYNAGFHGSQSTSSVNSMALGNGAYTTADNQVVIGNTSVTQTLLNGSVGIGTTSPAYLLDVSGSSRHGYRSSDTHQFTGSVSISGSLNATSSWSTNSLTASSLVSANSYTITNLTASNISASGTGSFGSVGIGTATPSQKLTVSGTGTVVGRIESTSNAGARDAQLQLYVNNSGGGDPAGSILFNASSSGGEISYGKIVVTNTVAAAAGNGEMQFWTSLSGTATERMRINKDGSVGIGTTSPGALLDVSGSSRHGYRSSDTHQFTGSVSISGSLNATSSWSTNALTASSLVSANSYTITNLTASNIRSNGTLHVNLGTIDCAQTGATLFVSANAITIGGGSMTTTFPGVLSVTGSTSLNSTLTVLGATVLKNTLSASGVVTASNIYGAGTLNVVGVSTLGTVSASIFVGSHTGSLFGTSSWSTNALTASSLVVGNSYNITNLTASNISASGTGSFGIVGIGSVSPGYKLDVNGTAQVDVLRIGYSSNQGTITYGSGLGMIVKSTSSQPLSLGAGGRNSDITINQTTGNVSIGLTSSVNRLDVAGNISCSVITASLFNGTSSWSTNALTASSLVVGNSYTITNLTASNISASGTSSFGRVGIGTLNPSGSLDVSGSIYTSAKLVQRSTTQSLSGSASCSIDLANGAVHILSLSSSAVISGLTYGNRDNNPHVNTIMLVLKYSGTATVTFTDVIWANAVTPSITAASGYADVFMLTSYKGGAVTPVWIGTVVSQALVSTNL